MDFGEVCPPLSRSSPSSRVIPAFCAGGSRGGAGVGGSTHSKIGGVPHEAVNADQEGLGQPSVTEAEVQRYLVALGEEAEPVDGLQDGVLDPVPVPPRWIPTVRRPSISNASRKARSLRGG